MIKVQAFSLSATKFVRGSVYRIKLPFYRTATSRLYYFSTSSEASETIAPLPTKTKRPRAYNTRPDFGVVDPSISPALHATTAAAAAAVASARAAANAAGVMPVRPSTKPLSSFKDRILQKAKAKAEGESPKSDDKKASSSYSDSSQEKLRPRDRKGKQFPVPTEIPKNPLYRPKPPKPAPVPEPVPDRPFTLPSGIFKPKQSLGQNYLSDQNYVKKIVECFRQQRAKRFPNDIEGDKYGQRVVEIGPGAGALTRVLVKEFPKMKAIEIDQRAVSLLGDKLPNLDVIHQDVLEFNWKDHFFARREKENIDSTLVSGTVTESGTPTDMNANPHVGPSGLILPKRIKREGGLHIVANLPYHIVSQVLFSLADNHDCIDLAVVTMQYEVAERITAKPNTKEYGIPSVVFQLYGETLLNFKIPPKVFYPVPKVDSALVTIDFSKPHRELKRVHGIHLRK